MPLLLLLALLLLPTPARADDRMVQAYLERCDTTLFTDLSEAVRGNFCACTAEKAQALLSPEEFTTLATGTGPAVDQDRMTTEIISPCLYGPIEEMERKDCLQSDQYTGYFSSPARYDAFCACRSEALGRFVKDYGRDLMAYILYRNPGKNIDDPVLTIMQVRQYQSERGQWIGTCLNHYAE